jgi:phytoene desaturase
LKKKIAIIGSGFSGLTAAAILASRDYDVHVYEKNETIGGRARQLKSDGFLFDMGPSWYWMPDVFEKFYNRFGNTSSDFYKLTRLDPSFTIIFPGNDSMKIPDSMECLLELFESKESGAAVQLKKFLKDAELKYKIAMDGMINKTSTSWFEFVNWQIIRNSLSINLLSSFSKHVRKYFRNPQLISLIEFPVLFLGAGPSQIPALYSLMNHAAFNLGTWYPIGGFGKITDAMKKIAETNGAAFHTGEPVSVFETEKNKIVKIVTNKREVSVDAVIGSADYNHIEQNLLPENLREYSKEYWNSRTLSPSALIFYLGIKKKINRLDHHNLFFDEDYYQHLDDIYKKKKWPSNPLFYVCCPSKSDDTIVPPDMENIFILMPLTSGINDDDVIRENYFSLIIKRIENYVGENISDHIIFKKSYCISDFAKDYNAYKGNAYGLANILSQTAVLKPRIISRKVMNLFYAGQMTVPGPGVPPSIISGQIASAELIKSFKRKNEKTI